MSDTDWRYKERERKKERERERENATEKERETERRKNSEFWKQKQHYCGMLIPAAIISWDERASQSPGMKLGR